MSASSTIPTVDVGALVSSGASQRAAVETMAKAGRTVGAFYIENHGLPRGLHERMFADAKRFFALSEPEKMDLFIGRDPSRYAGGYIPLCGETTQQRKDWHEALDVQPTVDTSGVVESPFASNLPLSRLPWLRDTLADAWPQLQELAYQVASGLALSLDLAEDYFRSAIREPLGVIRLAHYPRPVGALPEDVGEGIGPHTDYGLLTMIEQDDTGGLEVQDGDGKWLSVPRRAGALVVVMGRVIQRWTNDRYRAALHRVLIPRGQARYSGSFFFEPGFNTIIEPLRTCSSADNPPRYDPCNFGKLMALRYETSFGSYRQQLDGTPPGQ